MEQGLLQLLQLQEIDRELQALENAKQEYPEEIASRELEVRRAEETLNACSSQLEEAAKRQRQLERHLEDAKNALKAHEARFAEVTNNREYDALQMEIESCRRRIAECETQILEVIDTTESLSLQTAQEQARFEQIYTRQQAHIVELRQKLASLQEETDKVAARRQDFSRQVDANLLEQYQRSRKQPGSRVAAVRKSACGGCFRQLPAQHLSNVRRNDRVYFCENCGSILVWDDNSA